MGDLWIYAAVVFVSACIGTCVGTALSVHGPKKRIRSLENSLVTLTGIVIKIIEIGADVHAENEEMARSIHREMCTSPDCKEC